MNTAEKSSFFSPDSRFSVSNCLPPQTTHVFPFNRFPIGTSPIQLPIRERKNAVTENNEKEGTVLVVLEYQ